MDGLQDEAKQVDEGTAQEPQGAPAQVSGDDGAAAPPWPTTASPRPARTTRQL